MCGIIGFVDLSLRTSSDKLQTIATSMAETLRHRGPDDMGTWVDERVGIALGHRRLSIVDLSMAGHQPMHSVCCRYVMVFNGEIYNYKEIRSELEKTNAFLSWMGHSDTEVMLAAISEWGLEAALKRFVGMFAFALCDRKKRVLYLVRDRLGEKPLYYGRMGDVLLFGSELKALRAHPAWQGEISREALTLFMRYNYVPTPYSIYKGIYKLTPGTILSFEAEDQKLGHGENWSIKPYWQARQIAEAGMADPFTGTDADAITLLDRQLRNSVSAQMVADVPLGAFLSGGVDSSTVVALMQKQSSRPVKTFTIGFHEESYNEAGYAEAVAKHLGTDHNVLYVTPQEAMDVIPRLPAMYDEPFSDSSQIPTFLVSELARQHVAVSLSGDGGDELFAGYTRHFWSRNLWQKFGWMPRCLRGTISRLLTLLTPEQWDIFFNKFRNLLPKTLKQSNPGYKLHKLSGVLSVASMEDMYYGLTSHWKSPFSIVVGGYEPVNVTTDREQWANLDDSTLLMMYLDLVSYLPDDILVKVDRAAMNIGLESRVPFLDHRVVELAWRIPLSMKIRNGQGKWILRQLLYKYVPQKLIERPKTGFGIPIDVWLRGPLRDWAEGLLAEERLKDEGFFNPAPIRKKWLEHLSGVRNWQYHLWDVLMFQAWFQESSRN